MEEDEEKKTLPRDSQFFEGGITDSSESASDDDDVEDDVEKLSGTISKKQKLPVKEPPVMVGQICDGFSLKHGETLYEAATDHGNGKVDPEPFKGKRVVQLMEMLCDDRRPEEIVIRTTGKTVPQVGKRSEELLFLLDKSGVHHFGDANERTKGRKQVAISAIMKGRAQINEKVRRILNEKGRIAMCDLSADLEAKGVALGKLAAVPENELTNAMYEEHIISRINVEVEGLAEIRVSGFRNARRVADEEVVKIQQEKSLDCLNTRLLFDVKDIKWEIHECDKNVKVTIATGAVRVRLVPAGYGQTASRQSDSPTISAAQLRVILALQCSYVTGYLCIGGISRAFNMSDPEPPTHRCLFKSPENLRLAVTNTRDERLLWPEGKFFISPISIYGTLYGAADWSKTLSKHLVNIGYEQHWQARSLFRHDERSESPLDELLIGCHVDDVIISARSEPAAVNACRGTDSRFPVKAWEILCSGSSDFKRNAITYCGKTITTWTTSELERTRSGKIENVLVRWISVDLADKIAELSLLKLEVDESSFAARRAALEAPATVAGIPQYKSIAGAMQFIVECYVGVAGRKKEAVSGISPGVPRRILMMINEIICGLKSSPHDCWRCRTIDIEEALDVTDAALGLSAAEEHKMKTQGVSMRDVEKSGRYPVIAWCLGLLHSTGLPIESQREPVIINIDFGNERLGRRVWSAHAAEIVAARIGEMKNSSSKRLIQWASGRRLKSTSVLDSDSSAKSITSNGPGPTVESECWNSMSELREGLQKKHFDVLWLPDESNLVDFGTKSGQSGEKKERLRKWVRTCKWEFARTDKEIRKIVKSANGGDFDEITVDEILAEATMVEGFARKTKLSSIPGDEEPETIAMPEEEYMMHNMLMCGSLSDRFFGYKFMK